MRNLKRALSLALASVMLLGMMVVGTSAASYPDIDENDNVEAIEVLNAVNVMIGRQGNFEPDEAVNRHEMAVIMAKLVLGVETADNYVGTHPFTDVVPWADKYVAACYENGLVAGTSATTYGGGSPLTAVQAAAMMLRALGYKDLNKGYQGDWRAPITAMANQIRLFAGVASNPNEKLNRNQVAQLALNTLKSPMVNLKDGTFTATDGNGQLIISGGSREYIVLSSQEAYARAINDVESKGTSASAIGGYTVELGEHLYNGKLKLNNKDIDVFGRPSRTWEYDGKEIGSYIKEELMVKNDVGEVTGVDLYNLLGSSTIKDYDLNVYVDGINDPAVFAGIPNATQDSSNTNVVFSKADLNRNNKSAIGKTDTGVLMQVFVDHEDDQIYVAVINTYLAIADKAYDEKKEEASIQVYAIDKDIDNNYGKVVTATAPTTKPAENKETFKLGNEDFALVKDIAKDDPYLVTVADGAIQTIVPAEVLTGSTISAFKKADHVVSGGTTYKYASAAGYNYDDLYIYTSEADSISNLKDITYNIYLDGYGNLIGLKADDSPKNYVFLTSIDRNGSYVSNKTATATAIFPDGTIDTISINMTKSEWVASNRDANATAENFEFTDGDSLLNTWCTYTKSGEVYTVKEVWNNYNELTNANEAIRAPKGYTEALGGNNTNLAQFRSMTPAGGEITLKNGLRLRTGYPVGTNSYANVYGDSDSAYLTVELGKVTNTRTFGVINGVEGVFKGIDGTSITVWKDTDALTKTNNNVKGGTIANTDTDANGIIDDVSSGIYTLYDKDGLVIASVIVGEGSSAKDLVYVTSSDLSLEEDNGGNAKAAGDGKWTFHREVVRNGEKVMLTEVGDTVDALSSGNMKQHCWYQIKTNADGNVTSAIPAFQALDDYDVTTAAIAAGTLTDYGKDIFVDDYKNINNAVEKSTMDTVLYHTNAGPNTNTEESGAAYGYTHQGFNGNTKLSVKGNNTLAVDTVDGSGIYFRSDVNVVLTYWNRNKNQTEVIIDTGVDAVKDAVDFVNDNTKLCVDDHGGRVSNYVAKTYEDFFVSALIENGAATTIVIHDRFNDYSRTEDTTKYDQKLYLAGILGNNYYLSSNTEVYTVDADGRHPVPVDKDWNDWRNNVVRYSVKSGDSIAIYDPDISATYYPDFDSKVAVTPANWDITGKWLTFTMPKADVTIRDGVKPTGVEAEVDLTAAKVGPNGAEFTYDVDADGDVTLTGIKAKAAGAAKVATMTITLDKDGKVTDVKIVPVSADAEKVIKVTIKTGAKETEVAITNNAAQPKDVAVEAPKYVAVATVVDNEITKVEYNDDKLAAGGSLPIVDEKGADVTGTVAKADDNTVTVKGATIADGATINNGKETSGLNTDGTIGEVVATFDVTLEYDKAKVTVTSEPATLTDLKSGTKVTLTVAVKDTAKDEIDEVKAGSTTLTGNAGKYEFTVSADTTVTVSTKEKSTSTDATIKAKADGYTGDGTETFTFAMVSPVRALTKDEVLAAIGEALEANGVSSRGLKLADDNKTVTTTAGKSFKVDSTTWETPAALKTVTIDAKTYNVFTDLNEISGLTGIYYLVPEAAVVDSIEASHGVAVTDGTPGSYTAVTGAKFKSAIKVAAVADIASKAAAVEYQKADGTWAAVSTNAVQVGTPLRLKVSTIAAANFGTYSVTLNKTETSAGTTASASVVKDEGAATGTLTIDLGKAGASVGGTLTITHENKAGVKVSINGTTVKENGADKLFVEGDKVDGLTVGKTYVIGDFAATKVTFLDANQYKYVVALSDAENGVISIWDALEIKAPAENNGVFKVYSAMDEAGTDVDDPIAGDAAAAKTQYVAIKNGVATVYVKAVDNNTVLKFNSAVSVPTDTNPSATQPSAYSAWDQTMVAPAASTAGIWKLNMTAAKGGIHADEFVKGASAGVASNTMPVTGLDLSAANKSATFTITLSNDPGLTSVTATWGTSAPAKLAACTKEVSISGTTITVKLTTKEALVDLSGILNIDVGGVNVPFTVFTTATKPTIGADENKTTIAGKNGVQSTLTITGKETSDVVEWYKGADKDSGDTDNNTTYDYTPNAIGVSTVTCKVTRTMPNGAKATGEVTFTVVAFPADATVALSAATAALSSTTTSVDITLGTGVKDAGFIVDTAVAAGAGDDASKAPVATISAEKDKVTIGGNASDASMTEGTVTIKLKYSKNGVSVESAETYDVSVSYS